MLPKLIIPIFLLAAVACDRNPVALPKVKSLPTSTTLPAPKLKSSEEPVIVIYLDSYGLTLEGPRTRLITAVWPDGKIVWRKDRELLTGEIEPARIDDLIQRLHRENVFGDGNAYYNNTGPDAAFTAIRINLADRRLVMYSWHESAETSPRVVATSRGLESLNGRNRDAVLAAEPPEYKRFRAVWSDIRATVASWIPPEGAPFDGEVSLEFRD